MTAAPTSRRKFAPAVAMLIGLLGTLVLLLGFVLQTVRDTTPPAAEPTPTAPSTLPPAHTRAT